NLLVSVSDNLSTFREDFKQIILSPNQGIEKLRWIALHNYPDLGEQATNEAFFCALLQPLSGLNLEPTGWISRKIALIPNGTPRGSLDSGGFGVSEDDDAGSLQSAYSHFL